MYILFWFWWEIILTTYFWWFFAAANEIPSTPLLQVRERLTDRCISVLCSYRKFCATVTSSGQLILPETLKLLPLYILGIFVYAFKLVVYWRLHVWFITFMKLIWFLHPNNFCKTGVFRNNKLSFRAVGLIGKNCNYRVLIENRSIWSFPWYTSRILFCL